MSNILTALEKIDIDADESFNIDASFKSYESKAGIGMLLRDETGLCRAGRSITIWAGTAEQAEGLALHSAVTWARELGYLQVIFEGDSKSIMDYLNHGFADIGWRTKNILDECLIIAKSFNCCKFGFVYRTANCVADCLAKKACNGGQDDSWTLNPPPFLFDALNSDLTVTGARPTR
ncbi:hypothetical protein BVC80_9089g68 [Macleaya cordata]|uniref:RNase H type-1 domain-containing protein n=1 Tax=Macleaya cordata TaxID=56857 RepID=A0A200PQI7_MACCD|nr:hypothetical protein BVC80_9089g68 [Macleaya cordata]